MSTGIEDVFGRARAIADAVLWEGYVLYPYRRSAAKNRIRFQWGVVGPAEQPAMTATALVERARVDLLHVRLRALKLRRRDDGWDEADVVEHDVPVDLGDTTTERTEPIELAGGGGGQRISATLRITVAPDGAALRVTTRVENPGPPEAVSSDRDIALLHSLLGCHLLFAADDDVFVSLLEPPGWAVAAAGRCEQHRCWPVLVGPEPRRDLVMASPVILYDYPSVSPKSPGDFFDGTEIDEMLTLRVQTMTDEEKREARATDPRAAAIIDRCESMPDDVLAELHGTAQLSQLTQLAQLPQVEHVDPFPEWSDPGPGEVLVGGTVVTRGSKVVLRPTKRADIHDMFVIGRTATIAEVVHDVDGEVHLAVLIDDDPAADVFDAHGRFRYFSPDEVEPIRPAPSEEAGRGR